MMKKSLGKVQLPRNVLSTPVDAASVTVSFMERGSFEPQFSAETFVTKRVIPTSEKLSSEEDRARMM